jgi:hypothetical protein
MATDWVHIDTAWDMVRDECAKLQAQLDAERALSDLLAKERDQRTQERDEWRDLCERSIAMTEEWRDMCTQWQKHYYALKAQAN